MIKYLFLAVILCLSAVFDVKRHRIPNALARAGTLGFLLFFFAGHTAFSNLLCRLLGSGLISLFLLFLTIFTEKKTHKKMLGGGDIKLLFMTGLYFGLEARLYLLFFSGLAGLVCALVSLKKGHRSFPFAPAILFGTFLVLVIQAG